MSNAAQPRTLLLVKHAAPVIDPAIPACRWPLSDEGRRASVVLADRLAPFRLAVVVASQEPKATETGEIVAARLGRPFATAPDLHEHDRTGVPFLTNDLWHAAVRRFFAEPTALVLGRETATAAGERFARAVAAVRDRHPAGNLAIIAHGTVISLFVARRNPMEPFALWKRLKMPSFVVLGWSDLALREIVPNIAGDPGPPTAS